jgi:putative ABC transport system permease protein
MLKGLNSPWRMIGAQSWKSIVRRPGRSAVTATGVAVGLAIFLTAMGLSSSTNAAVNATFDKLATTQIQISDIRPQDVSPLFDTDFDAAVARIDGVLAGGQLWLASSSVTVSRTVAHESPALTTSLIAVSPGALDAVGATTGFGRNPNGRVLDGAPWVLLGPRAARDLGLESFAPGTAVFIRGRAVTVAGVLESVGSAPELSTAVMVEPAVVADVLGVPAVGADEAGVVRVRPGSARVVAAALALAVRPNDPARVGVLSPPEALSLRSSVQGSLTGLMLGMAALTLVMGGLAIGNSLMSAVAQRAGEIGLRRALGASRAQIVGQFLFEGAVLGVAGAIAGTIAGLCSLLVVASHNGWVAVLDPTLIYLAPAAGALVGLGASAHPAGRAAHLVPAETLRR